MLLIIMVKAGLVTLTFVRLPPATVLLGSLFILLIYFIPLYFILCFFDTFNILYTFILYTLYLNILYTFILYTLLL